MRSALRLSVVVMAAVLTITPLGAATWSAFGSYEPDTSYDTDAFMWDDAGPGGAKPRIYFNAWSATQAAVNYNVGTLQTANAGQQMERPSAMLGVWVDCNGDGFVGLAESALYEYSSALLLDDSTCPPETGDDDNWTVGSHNYNGWVTELIPITPDVAVDGVDFDTRRYVASDVRVWADVGTPGESSETSGGGSCALTPLPRGTIQSTGGALNYADCGTGLLEAWNTAAAASNGALPVFADEDDARGSFADVGTFGSEDSSHAAVTVVDCDSEESSFDSAATANDTGVAGPVQTVLDAASSSSGEDLGQGYEYYGFSLPALNPTVGNTQDPTVPGQVNQTNEEFNDNCETSDDAGHDFYSAVLGIAPEGDQVSVPVVGKNAVDWSFGYSNQSRGEPLRLTDGPDLTEDAGSAGMSSDLGIGPTRGLLGSSWFGQGNLIRAPPLPVATRGNLETEDPAASDLSVVGAPGEWITFFAFVSSDVTSQFTTTTGAGIYGFEQCQGDFTGGIRGGWDCDAENWNLDAEGNKLPGQELLAAVGQPYNFRDVDCYDGSSSAFRWSDAVDPEAGEGCTR